MQTFGRCLVPNPTPPWRPSKGSTAVKVSKDENLHAHHHAPSRAPDEIGTHRPANAGRWGRGAFGPRPSLRRTASRGGRGRDDDPPSHRTDFRGRRLRRQQRRESTLRNRRPPRRTTFHRLGLPAHTGGGPASPGHGLAFRRRAASATGRGHRRKGGCGQDEESRDGSRGSRPSRPRGRVADAAVRPGLFVTRVAALIARARDQARRTRSEGSRASALSRSMSRSAASSKRSKAARPSIDTWVTSSGANG